MMHVPGIHMESESVSIRKVCSLVKSLPNVFSHMTLTELWKYTAIC